MKDYEFSYLKIRKIIKLAFYFGSKQGSDLVVIEVVDFVLIGLVGVFRGLVDSDAGVVVFLLLQLLLPGVSQKRSRLRNGDPALPDRIKRVFLISTSSGIWNFQFFLFRFKDHYLFSLRSSIWDIFSKLLIQNSSRATLSKLNFSSNKIWII